MPRISFESALANEELLPLAQPLTPEEQADPSTLDVLAAGFRQSNIVSSLYDRISSEGMGTFTKPDAMPDYDALTDLDGYEDFSDRFLRSDSPAETARIKARIERELADRETLRRAGGGGLAASIAAGALDPTTIASMMLPVAPAIAGASRATRIGAGVAANIALDSAAEAALHSGQELRTVQDSVINVGAGALLTGLFGTLATRVPKHEFEQLRKTVGEQMARPDLYPAPKSGGSAAVVQTTLADESIARGGKTIAKVAKNLNPLLRVFDSASVEARRVVQRLVEVPFQLEKNRKGIATATSVEAKVRGVVNSARFAVVKTLDNFRKAMPAGERLSSSKFSEAIAQAMRRGDKSGNLHVANAARVLRGVVNDVTRAAQEVGALPEELTTEFAESYFPRVYHVQKILGERAQFERVLRDHFTLNPKQGGEELLESDIEEAVQRTVENITGARLGDAKLSNIVVPTAGPLKGRKLSVPDEVLEPWLVSDVEHVLGSFLRKVVPHTELTREFGTADMREALDQITQDYRQAKIKAGDDATRNALDKEMGGTLGDLQALRDRVLGSYGAPSDPTAAVVRMGRFARQYNYLRLMGGMVLSSIPDVGRVMTHHGLPKTLGNIGKFIASPSFRKMSLADAQRFGTALEMAVETRGASFADIGDEFYVGSKLDKSMRSLSNSFSRWSGMAPWNTAMKSVTSSLAQDAVLRAAKSGKLSQFQRAQFAAAGIDDDMLERIAEQARKHGIRDGGLERAASDAWEDRVAANALEEFVRREADLLVLTKGVADTPLFLSTELGKTLFQFRSFSLAGVNRLAIGLGQGVAAGDSKAISGLAAMLSLGVLTYAVKEKVAGREVDTAPQKLLAEALDKSGVISIGAEVWDPLAYMTGVPFRFSRFSDRAPQESFLGPTYGTIGELIQGIRKTADGDLTQEDIHRLRKLAPLQNLWYLRSLLNAMEGEAGETLGVDGSDEKSLNQRLEEQF